MYAVTRDGQRFIIRLPVGAENVAVEQLYIVTNWASLVGHQPSYEVRYCDGRPFK